MKDTKKNYKDKIVFITGAAHGIGLSLARLYDQHGARVIAVDIDSENLKKAEKWLQNAYFFCCDITDRQRVYELGARIIREIGVPDIVVNNAGIVENAKFLDCPDHLLEKTMNVNIISHFWVLKAFLPAMISKGDGHICAIASAAGLMGVPGMATYCASKHSVIGFTKALALEVNQIPNANIRFTIVSPSFITTGMFEGVKPPLFTPLLSQEKIANIIFRSVDKNREIVLEPFMVKLLPLLSAILPNKVFNFVARTFRVTQAMDDILLKQKRVLKS
ncbi:MAG: hypothetical protein A3F16_06750 [Deltaproteobacteria bacterium RIFCSPHIGHO2_12_FULL_43_9]|nr:MAG: hypothetical protein A3F16_06750 [Deltaproteobacteria bacterium RIFCSPHIGHO2_12_FULL_43_9]